MIESNVSGTKTHIHAVTSGRSHSRSLLVQLWQVGTVARRFRSARHRRGTGFSVRCGHLNLGISGYIYTTAGGLRFITDPTFDPPRDYQVGPFIHSKTVGPAIPTDKIGDIDVVLLSHDHHFDNIDHAGRELLSKVERVLTTTAGAERLQGNAIGLEVWQSIDLPAPNGKILSITGTPARHGPAGGDRGPVIGFLLSCKDSRDEAIYISGDTVWYEGVEETLNRFPNIHVAVLFVGARVPVLPANLTLSAAKAVRVAEALPKVRIVPVHFEGWKHLTESKEDLSKAFCGCRTRGPTAVVTGGQGCPSRIQSQARARLRRYGDTSDGPDSHMHSDKRRLP